MAFGATPAGVFTVNNDTRITATAPAGASTTAQVKVTTAGGVSATVPAAYYSYGTRVVAWGANSAGQITVPSGLVDVHAIAAGHGHSLALQRQRHGGGVGKQCWWTGDGAAGLNNVIAMVRDANIASP